MAHEHDSTSLEFVNLEGARLKRIEGARLLAGWNESGESIAYVVPEKAGASADEPWCFLLPPVRNARESVVVSKPDGDGRVVFSGMHVSFPAWSPKGDRMVFEYSVTRGNIYVVDLQ